MKAKIFEYEDQFSIQLEPETIEESSALARFIMKADIKSADADMNFGAGNQTFTIDTQNYKSRNEYSMITNKLKIL